MSEHFRSIPGDPGGELIGALFDTTAEDWHLTAAGGYQTGAAETFRDDGSDFQRVVVLEWPTRLNKTTKEVTLRLIMSPEDALGLADNLIHTARWMLRNQPRRSKQ